MASMRYTRVQVEAIGYELAPEVITSDEIEDRLESLYRALRIPRGQLEGWTGIRERRWWEPGYPLSSGATAAARRALSATNVRAEDLEVVIYGGVCREQFEPATACRVAADLGVQPDIAIHDVSNACLGVLNGMVDIANRIELGQIRAGLVVSCESAREIVDDVINDMLARPDMEVFRERLATLTGGSGAAAVLLTDGSFGAPTRHRLVSGAARSAPQFHELCRWGIEAIEPMARQFRQFMITDSVGVLKHGAELGLKTWEAFLRASGWAADQVDRVICHQVGKPHRDAIMAGLGISTEKDYPTFPYLGNMGTVSLPMTAALAEERGFLREGDRVGLLGIASGLNCLMLGLEW